MGFACHVSIRSLICFACQVSLRSLMWGPEVPKKSDVGARSRICGPADSSFLLQQTHAHYTHAATDTCSLLRNTFPNPLNLLPSPPNLLPNPTLTMSSNLFMDFVVYYVWKLTWIRPVYVSEVRFSYYASFNGASVFLSGLALKNVHVCRILQIFS